MRYTKPAYTNESVEISDVIQASIVAVAYVDRGTGVIDPVTQKEIVVKTTQVSVDVSGLF